MYVSNSDGSIHIDGCCICSEISEGIVPKEIRDSYGVTSRCFLKDDDFYVVPSVSPLCEGHTLVFSKAHSPSIGDLPECAIQRLQEVVKSLVRQLQLGLNNPLIFEHGARSDDPGCGINHAHLHIVPVSSIHRQSIVPQLKRDFPTDRNGNLVELLSGSCSTGSSYLMYGFDCETMSLALRDDIPSQHVRRIVASALCKSEWNWKTYSGRPEFRTTLEILRHVELASS